MKSSSEIESTFSKRIERKRLIDQEYFSFVARDNQSTFNSLFEESPYQGKSVCHIRNTYLDDQSFTNYADSVFSREVRLKVRIREYLSDDPQLNLCYFEIKSKICDVTFKKRLAFDRSFLEYLDSTQFEMYLQNHKDQIIRLNQENSLEEVNEFLKEMVELVVLKLYSPVLTTTYRRHSFALRSNPEIRLTIDDSIHFSLIRFSQFQLPPYSKLETESRVVVEVKSLVHDDMMAKFLMQEVFGNEESFSKYCCGVYKSHRMLQQHGAAL